MVACTAVAAKPSVGINGKTVCRVTEYLSPGHPCFISLATLASFLWPPLLHFSGHPGFIFNDDSLWIPV
jgi:hypothetical protein